MQISSRFPVAVHTLLCIHKFQNICKVTSDFIAASVGVNPVIIRKTMGLLKKAEFIDVTAGTGGTRIIRPLETITLYEVYTLVDPVEKNRLFDFHKAPNLSCPVGKSIQPVLDKYMEKAQQAMENSLKSVKLSELAGEMETAENSPAD